MRSVWWGCMKVQIDASTSENRKFPPFFRRCSMNFPALDKAKHPYRLKCALYSVLLRKTTLEKWRWASPTFWRLNLLHTSDCHDIFWGFTYPKDRWSPVGWDAARQRKWALSAVPSVHFVPLVSYCGSSYWLWVWAQHIVLELPLSLSLSLSRALCVFCFFCWVFLCVWPHVPCVFYNFPFVSCVRLGRCVSEDASQEIKKQNVMRRNTFAEKLSATEKRFSFLFSCCFLCYQTWY